MEFIIMTLSFTVAILLASGLAFFMVLNKKVMKWYLKKVNNITMDLFEEIASDGSEE
jgi:hypothetical protein